MMKQPIGKSVEYLRVGLNWKSESNGGVDLDLSAFLLDGKGMVRDEGDFVFYNHPVSVGEALILSGDDRVGEVDGPNETIFVDLKKIPGDVAKAVFCVTFDESEGEHIFGEAESIVLYATGVSDRYDKGDRPFCSVDLATHCPQSSAMAVFEISRGEDGWEYGMICESADFGLLELCSRYGLAVE